MGGVLEKLGKDFVILDLWLEWRGNIISYLKELGKSKIR